MSCSSLILVIFSCCIHVILFYFFIFVIIHVILFICINDCSMNLKFDIKCNLTPSLNLDEGRVLSFRILNLIESSLFSGYCAANREILSWSRWNKHEIILFLLVFPVFLVLANDIIFCPVTSCCSHESTQQQSYQNNAAIELINSVTGADEEGKSRQRVLVYAARR